MPRKLDDRSLYFELVHFNVRYKTGALDHRVGARHFKGVDPSQIGWVWIVESNRRATDDEIKQLCAGTWKATVN
jgi:hypothetical protein